MKTILIFANSTLSVYKFRKELITELIKNGYHVIVSCPDDGFRDELDALGITFIDTPLSRHGMNPLQDFFLLRKYKKIIYKIKPDIILTYTIKPNIYGNLAAVSYGIPVISTITGLGQTFLQDNLVSRIVKLLYYISFRKVACIVFQNEEDRETFKWYRILKNQHNIHVTGSGVNLNEFNELPLPKSKTIRFLFVGRIFEAKGVDFLIEASRQLKEEFAERFETVLIGYYDADYKQIIENAQDKGYIRYEGFQKDVISFIRQSHCVVLPSYSEGMSNALLEAAAMGRPIITTNISGCREIVDDGINGFLCEPRDMQSLYQCMKKFLSFNIETAKRMGQASREKMVQEFNRKTVVAKMLELIESLTK